MVETGAVSTTGEMDISVYNGSFLTVPAGPYAYDIYWLSGESRALLVDQCVV